MAVPVITSVNKKTTESGVALFTHTVTATNTPTSFAATNLPGWLAFNTTTGVATGTVGTAGTRTITFTATNGDGASDPQTFLLFISPAGTPQITSSLYITGQSGTTLTYQATATHSPTLWTISTIPAGGTFETNTGLLTLPLVGMGLTTAFNIHGTNAVGDGANANVTLVITPPVAGNVPTITSPTTASAVIGEDFIYQLTTDTDDADGYNQNGTLIPDLVFDDALGIISGQTSRVGTAQIGFRAHNANGLGPSGFVLTITSSRRGGDGGGEIPPPPPIAGIYEEFPTFAEADADPCDFIADAPPPSGNPPTNLILSTPGTTDSGIINVSWTPP